MRAMNTPRGSSLRAKRNNRGLRLLPAITVCVVALAAMVACSPPERHRGPRHVPWQGMNIQPPTAAELLTMMKDRLKLTASQEEAVHPVMEEHCKKRDLIMQRYTEGGPSAYGYFKGATRALEQETEAHLGTILTKKQMAKYREIEEERQKRMQGPEGGGMGRPGGGGMEGGMGGE